MIAHSRELEQKSRELRGDRAGAHPRQCAAQGARPAEGRLPLDRQPRAAHAADLDPHLLGNPRATATASARSSAERYLDHHPERDAAADAAARHHPRPDAARAGPGRLADGRRRPEARCSRTRSPRPAGCSARRAPSSRSTIEPATAPFTADRDRLMQVFINLLSNAAKFCRSRARPRARCRARRPTAATWSR